MSVVVKEQENKLILEIDNGDLTKMKEVLQKWKFKDVQSFWRFSISILLETEDKALWIKANDKPIAIGPAKHSINNDNDEQE